jgi:hypothetical protein
MAKVPKYQYRMLPGVLLPPALLFLRPPEPIPSLNQLVGQSEYGYSQEVQLVPQAGAGCSFPYWIKLNRVGICEPYLVGGCTVVTACEGLGYKDGDQTQCCGWECGAGSRCIGTSSPLTFPHGKCIAWKGELHGADGSAQVAHYLTAKMRILQGCGSSTIVYDTDSLGTWTGVWGDFILSWTIDGALWAAVSGKTGLTAHLVILGV